MNDRKILIIPNKLESNKLLERLNEILDRSSVHKLNRIKYKNLKDLFSLKLLKYVFSIQKKSMLFCYIGMIIIW